MVGHVPDVGPGGGGASAAVRGKRHDECVSGLAGSILLALRMS